MSFSPADATIRLIGPDDSIADLTEFLHRAYAQLAAQGLLYTATWQTDDVTRTRIARGECYLARLGGTLCGTIIFKSASQTSGNPWYDKGDVASFGQFAVDPGLQRKGLGRTLIALAEHRALETGAHEIALDTAEPATHLIALYAKLGYRFIEYAQWGTTNYRSVIMSKTLRQD
ncbi:MAG: GNAT family N-acetyltransferase [Devosia sp.]